MLQNQGSENGENGKRNNFVRCRQLIFVLQSNFLIRSMKRLVSIRVATVHGGGNLGTVGITPHPIPFFLGKGISFLSLV